MDKIVKNTLREFELTNGEVVNLTLTFGKLSALKSINPTLYAKYNRIMNGKSEDILDIATVVYVAYWCANYGKDEMYTESDFMDLVPFDLGEIKRTMAELTRPKKK